MSKNDYLELIFGALPKDANIAELRQYVLELREAGVNVGAADILQKCSGINWEAYLRDYPDVKADGIDPREHFLRFGLYEGRKLKSRHSFYQPPPERAPEVSVVIPSYNNGVFLEKCLGSLFNQTLKNIEIIIVDDRSEDNSLDIARVYAAADSRVRLIVKRRNEGTHMARKSGVAAATGRYIMFLDADDFYMPYTCERAVNLARLGHDITCFELNVISHQPGARNGAGRTEWFGRLPAGAYDNFEKINFSFSDNVLPNFMHNKIFERSFCQRCFALMDDFYDYMYQDMYEFLILNYYARSLYKSDEVLINYSLGSGITTRQGPGTFIRNIDRNIAVLKSFEIFCRDHQLDSIYLYFKKFLITRALWGLTCLPRWSVMPALEHLRDYFDDLYILRHLRETYAGNLNSLAMAVSSSIQPFKPRGKKVAIQFLRLYGGEVEDNLRNFCVLLLKHGYEVTLLLHQKSGYDNIFDDKLHIEHINAPSAQPANMAHLSELRGFLEKWRPDIFIDWWCNYPTLLWETIICRMLDIAILSVMNFDHNIANFQRDKTFQHKTFLKVACCLDKILCPNISTEIYLRANGVDAMCLPSLARAANVFKTAPPTGNYVAVMGKLENVKVRAISTLYILKETLKKVPDVKFIYIGSFADNEARARFCRTAEDLGLGGAFEVVDAHEDEQLPEGCKLLLSCMFIEGFSNVAAKAQAAGMPVVMYDLDVAPPQNNESVIRVPQGDIRAAAESIARLLLDDRERQRLARIAMESSRGAPRGADENSDMFFLGNFYRLSPFISRGQMEYRDVIAWQAFYAGKAMPAFQDI